MVRQARPSWLWRDEFRSGVERSGEIWEGRRMKRKQFSRLQRVRIFDEHKGICCICDWPIDQDRPWVVEHVVSLSFGGTNDPSNLGPAHLVPCARTKTAVEWRMKTKADRQRANYLGVKKRSKGRPMMGTVASGWRKKLNGDVVRR